LINMKMVAPKPAAIAGAIPSPAKIAPRPFPPFHPQVTDLAPTVATPTPAMAEIKEYVDETWAECRVHHMTHVEAPARAQVKASICTPASPRKEALGMIPFLIVSAVLAPTRIAPSISKIVPVVLLAVMATYLTTALTKNHSLSV
jgi:hypothetical protein